MSRSTILLAAVALVLGALVILHFSGSREAVEHEAVAPHSVREARSEPRAEIAQPSSEVASQRGVVPAEAAPLQPPPRIAREERRLPGSILGHVDASGAGGPLRDGRLALSREGGSPRWAPIGANGDFEVSALELGTWTVRAEVQGFLPAESKVTLTEEAKRARCDLTLQAKRKLRITVLDTAGQPLGGPLDFKEKRPKPRSPTPSPSGASEITSLAASIRPVLTERTPSIGPSSSGSWGSLAFRSQSRGMGEFVCTIDTEPTAACCASVWIGDLCLARSWVAPASDSVVLVVDPRDLRAAFGTVDLAVVDSDSGAALETAQCVLRPSNAAQVMILSDAHGRAHFSDVAPGDLEIEVRAADHLSAKRSLRADAGGQVDAGTIALQSCVSIAGSSRCADDAKSSYDVVLYRVRDTSRPIERTWSVASATGNSEDLKLKHGPRTRNFEFDGLERGEYVIGAKVLQTMPTALDVIGGKAQGFLYVDARRASVRELLLDVPPLTDDEWKQLEALKRHY